MSKIIILLLTTTTILLANDLKIEKKSINTKKEVLKKKELKKVSDIEKSSFKSEHFDSVVTIKKVINLNKEDDITLDITPKGEWHINKGFPIKFKLKSDCKSDKKKYKKKDLKSITEKDLSVDMKLKCEKKGNQTVIVTGAFGVCSKDMCKRETIKLKVKTEVK